MAGENDDIIVTIEGDDVSTEQDTIVTVADTTQQPQRKSSDDPIETLKAQLAEKEAENASLKQRATTAESVAGQASQRATVAETEAQQARREAAASTKTTVESGIAAAKAERDAAREALESAFESGDKKALGDAQVRIATAAADLAMLEQAKAELPAAPEVRQQPQRPSAPTDQTEQWISNLSPRSQTWIRGHMDYATDQRKNAKVVSAHHDAMAEGLQPDSDAYFEHLEQFLGIKQKPGAQERQQPTNGGTQTTQRRPSAPTAPVTPTGGGVQGGQQEVTLTKGESERANDGTIVWNYPDPTGKNRWKVGDPIGNSEMGKRKLALMKAGRYLNSNIDGT
jgi:hypothetical protein